MTRITNNLYGLNRRASSSENHVVPATNMTALFAFSEHDVLTKALRDLTLATDMAMAADVLERLDQRLARGMSSIRRVRNDKAKGFLSDLDNLRLVPDEMFDAPKVAWLFGSVSGLVAVNAIAATAAAAAAHSHDVQQLQLLIEGVSLHMEGARLAWDVHRAEILKANPQVAGDDVVFELVMADSDAPFYRIVVTAEEGA